MRAGERIKADPTEVGQQRCGVDVLEYIEREVFGAWTCVTSGGTRCVARDFGFDQSIAAGARASG